MLRLFDLSKSYAGRVLFEGIDWQITSGERVGLVGPNGVGKSTLFRILVGQEEPDTGTVELPRAADVGYLPQEIDVDSEGSLLEFILEGARALLDMEAQLAELEHQLGQVDGEQARQLSQRYGDLQDLFRRKGGYAVRSRAREIAAGMGFEEADFGSSLETFSGGWRMRALLSRLLLRRPELLLLDEPTNHLDLESVEWLEGFLRLYEGAVIVISHDRYFLNRIVTGISELRPGGIEDYPGDYDTFMRMRKEQRERLKAQAEQQQKERERLEEFIERFRYKATKARQVQSRIKQLERMDQVEVFEIQSTAMRAFRFPEPERLPRIVAQARDIAKAYEDNVVYEAVDFQVIRGDRVALVGPNGSGKSTMLRILAGALEPDRGEVTYGPGVDIAYFAQHSVDGLDVENTLLGEMKQAATSETSGTERDVLGALGFSGNDSVSRKISVLSGGEKTRLAFAKILMRPAGLLLLDEPTNHLDIESRELLEEAIRAFGGAVCIVSHDRYFLNEVVERVVHVEGGELVSYLGDYDYYQWKRTQELEQAAASAGVSSSSGSSAPAGASSSGGLSKKELRQELAQLRVRKNTESAEARAELEDVEAAIEAAEARHADLEAELADPAVYEDPERLPKLNRAYQSAEQELEVLMERWERAQKVMDEIEARYQLEEDALRGEAG